MSMPSSSVPAKAGRRLASLDQFRGYTVTAMLVVNFLSGFAVTPKVMQHHNTYCSYADTVMPQFLFAVGFAFRLSFGRHAQREGLPAAYRRVLRRLASLALLAIFLYTLGALRLGESRLLPPLHELAKRDWFQTLLHIAVTSLWILPVIRAGTAVRVAYLVFSALLHVGLSSAFNFAWVHSPPRGIDGGPLGFLTWAIPALVGTLACDALVGAARPQIGRLLGWAAGLALLGYGLSCLGRMYDVPEEGRQPPPPELADSPVVFSVEQLRSRPLSSLLVEPPFVAPPGPAQRQGNYWTMSQRSGSVSYLVFAAGFSLAVLVVFHLLSDRWGWQLGLFRTLGSNALVAYILGGMMEVFIKPQIARDAPAWQVMTGFALAFGTVYVVVALLEKKGILLRL